MREMGRTEEEWLSPTTIDQEGSSRGAYGKGRQASDGWGGDAGRRWAAAVARRIDAAERRL